MDGKTALLLVDIQYDFLPPDGSLAVPEGDKILPLVYRLLDDAHARFDLIVASMVSSLASSLVGSNSSRIVSALINNTLWYNARLRSSRSPRLVRVYSWQRALYGYPSTQVEFRGEDYANAMA